MPSHKLCLNWKLYLLLNQILYVFRFSWFLGCALSIDEQMICFKGRHTDKIRIIDKNKGGGFQVDALCDRGYT